MGDAGRKRVENYFSFPTFSDSLDSVLRSLMSKDKKKNKKNK